MSNSFVSTFKSYVDAILEIHPKYSTKKYHDKAVETVNSVLDMAFTVLEQLNSDDMITLNEMNIAPITDDVLDQFKKNRKVSKKAVKTLNIYTAMFIPIVRKFAEPMLRKYDDEEPDVYYNRITSINSIASKIYKNLTNPDKYSDTYEYNPEATEGKIIGVIVSSVSDPTDAERVRMQYQNIIEQLGNDKNEIEKDLENVSEEELKDVKNNLVDTMLTKHAHIYDKLQDYIISFMDRYKDALRDMCLDKPLKKKTTKTNIPPANIPIVNEPPVFTLPPVEDIHLPTMPTQATPARNPKLPQVKKTRKTKKN